MILGSALGYEITRQYSHGSEKMLAKFSEEKDALEFMQAKAAWDHKTKVLSIYRLYDDGEITQEINSAEKETLGSSSGGMGTAKSTGPSPLSMTAHPAGAKPFYTPHKDPNNDDDL